MVYFFPSICGARLKKKNLPPFSFSAAAPSSPLSQICVSKQRYKQAAIRPTKVARRAAYELSVALDSGHGRDEGHGRDLLPHPSPSAEAAPAQVRAQRWRGGPMATSQPVARTMSRLSAVVVGWVCTNLFPFSFLSLQNF